MHHPVSVEKPLSNEIPDYPNIQKIKKAAVIFIHFALALLITFIIIRGGEFILISVSNDLPSEYLKIVSSVLFYDLIFFLKLIAFLFIPFVLVHFITKNNNVNFWIFGILSTFVIFIYTLLIQYYGTALVPLGSDLFGYSLQELNQTVSGTSEVNLISILLVLLPVISFWPLLYLFHSKKFIKPVYAYLTLGIGTLIAYFGISSLPAYAGFKSDFAYNISINKAAYFTEQSLDYFSDEDSEQILETENPSNIQGELLAGGNSFNYLNPDYPFLRTEDTKDVLSNFFKIDSANRPNIIFIQVEGLGRAFSGKNAYLKSFTPFIDELAEKGLFWENFLAAQGRTFASLASILGSLPFAENGYNALGDKMPKHFSLLNILNHNGYNSNYYAGFEMKFDNMGLFMKNSGNNLIVSADDFGDGFTKASSWGYSDKDLMIKYLEKEAKNAKQPFISYIETMSMHSPYTVPNQAEYVQMFETRMKELGFDGAMQKRYNQYKEIYSSIMYTDESIRYFFEEYAKLPSFKNTIFIITGDHRLPEIPMSTKIDRYHVPLIIYSPLLKRSASFKSISSHFDITPSLLAFMKVNYKINSPAEVAWVGSGLDTARAFGNIHKYPLKHTRSSLHNYVYGLNFVDMGQLFKISDNMNLEPLQDEKILKQVQYEFDIYKKRNNRFKKDLKLIPESTYNKFTSKVD